MVTDTPAAPPPIPESIESPSAHRLGGADATHVATRTEATDDDREAPLDLDAIERDLAATEAALTRLDDGSYWRDEVTGADIPDDVLAADPLARRAAT